MSQKQHLCKIYSRNRIKIFKPKRYKFYNQRKDKSNFLLFLIITMIAIITCLMFYNCLDPIFEDSALTEAKAIATRITNEESTRAIIGYTYDDLFKIEKNSDGNN